jgi:hypothetical protein
MKVSFNKTIGLFFIPLFLFLLLVMQAYTPARETQNSEAVYTVAKTNDFTVTGDGSNPNWQKAEWLPLTQRRPVEVDPARSARVKMLYSPTGVYCLFDCPDKKITATKEYDFADLWLEDVVEVFFWTDESSPTYFEYEISPLNYDLPILISNHNGDLTRWQPFHYDADRHTCHAVKVRGGEQKPHAEITGWTAEFFIPYKLLRPLHNIQPVSGTKWRANFYRIDYDEERSKSWSWQLTQGNFHDYLRFGTLLFK